MATDQIRLKETREAHREKQVRISLLDPEDLRDNSGIFKGLILYEDKATGLRAKRTLDLLGTILKAGEELNSTMWRFDMLQDGAFFKEVTDAALRADVVLLSAHGERGLPEVVTTWLGWWLSQESDGSPAIVALLDANAERSKAIDAFLGSLKSMTSVSGTDLFLHFSDGPGWNRASGAQADAENEADDVAVMSRGMQPGTRRHWEINE